MGASSIFDNPYYQGATQGVAAGLAQTGGQQFQSNPMGTLSAIGQGFATAGPVGAFAAGITSAIGQGARVRKELNQINPLSGQVDYLGDQPIYNAAGVAKDMQTARGIGSALNKKFGGISSPWNRRKAEEKRDELQRAIRAYQQDFNSANEMYQHGNLARRAYEDQLANVYGIPQGYY